MLESPKILRVSAHGHLSDVKVPKESTIESTDRVEDSGIRRNATEIQLSLSRKIIKKPLCRILSPLEQGRWKLSALVVSGSMFHLTCIS